MKVTIEISDDIAAVLTEGLKDITGPPVRQGAVVVTPLLYPDPVPDWVAEVMANNIGNLVRHRPTPAMQQLQQETAALETRAKALLRPTVTVEKPNLPVA